MRCDKSTTVKKYKPITFIVQAFFNQLKSGTSYTKANILTLS